MARKVVKKRRIKYTNLLLLIVIFILFGYLLMNIFDLKISNIYILNNNILSDQTIIELSQISDYPSALTTFSSSIEKKLRNNIYIKNANVYKKRFRQVYIEVEENKPLFFYKTNEYIVLSDARTTTDLFDVPILINYVPDTLYDVFVNEMSKINEDILNRISEIKYDPNAVDNERFLLTMIDGNLVYLTLNKFNKINNYIDIIKKFNTQKGILYLDAGEYFEKFNK